MAPAIRKKPKPQEEHSPLSPSSSKRWLVCPASYIMCKDIPRRDPGLEAKWGSVVHKIAEVALKKDLDAKHTYRVGSFPIKDIDVPVEKAMYRVAQDYIDVCRELQLKHPEASSYVERKLTVDRSTEITVFGTVDFILRCQHTLYIVDLKSGTVSVDADSTQLRMYGWGAMNEFPGAKRVVLIIVQPRDRYGNTYKECTLSRDEVVDWVHDVMQPGIEACQSANPKFNPTEDGCRWCPAKATEKTGCKPLADHNRRIALREFSTLSEAEMVKCFDTFSLIRIWMDAVSDALTERVLSGKKVKGMKAVRGRMSRVWSVDDEDLVARRLIKYGLSEDEVFKRSLITAPQAAQLIDKEYLPQVEKMIEKKPGKITVVSEKDKRPAIGVSVGEDFDD